MTEEQKEEFKILVNKWIKTQIRYLYRAKKKYPLCELWIKNKIVILNKELEMFNELK